MKKPSTQTSHGSTFFCPRRASQAGPAVKFLTMMQEKKLEQDWDLTTYTVNNSMSARDLRMTTNSMSAWDLRMAFCKVTNSMSARDMRMAIKSKSAGDLTLLKYTYRFIVTKIKHEVS